MRCIRQVLGCDIDVLILLYTVDNRSIDVGVVASVNSGPVLIEHNLV